MSQQDTSHNYRQSDVSTATTNQHALPARSTQHPIHSGDLFACIERGRLLVTVTPYGWLTYLRRENPTEYAVRFENENGVLSGTLSLDRHEARRLLIEKVCEAVWIDVRPRTAWPTADERMEVSA